MTDTFSRLDSREPSARVFAEGPGQGTQARRIAPPAAASEGSTAGDMPSGLDGTQAFWVGLYGRKVEGPLAGAARFEQLRLTANRAGLSDLTAPGGPSPLRDRIASLGALARDLQEQVRRGGRGAPLDRVEDLESGLQTAQGDIATRFTATVAADAGDERRRAHYETHLLADSYNRLVGVADGLRSTTGPQAHFLDADVRIFPTARFASRQQLLARLHELANLTRREASVRPDAVAAIRALATDYRVRLGNLGGPGENATRPVDLAMRRYFNRIIEGWQTAQGSPADDTTQPFLRPSEEAAFERLKFHFEATVA